MYASIQRYDLNILIERTTFTKPSKMMNLDSILRLSGEIKKNPDFKGSREGYVIEFLKEGGGSKATSKFENKLSVNLVINFALSRLTLHHQHRT